jgi:hypothetical protein
MVMGAKRAVSPGLKIEVTKELIEDAKGRDSSHCMIAEAVKAAFPEASYVSVDLQTIRFSDPVKRLRYTYLTPRIAQIALIDFDQEVTPEPFDFTLRRGQVTLSGGREGRERRRLSEAEQQQRAAAGKRGNEARRATLKSQELVGTKQKLHGAGPGGDDVGVVPEKLGGKTPPKARAKDGTPISRRREFGIRALVR